MDRVTFDFETGEIIFDTDTQKGIEIDPTLKEKRTAIMTAAGYEEIKMQDLLQELDERLTDAGIHIDPDTREITPSSANTAQEQRKKSDPNQSRPR